jgi:hypothetical protein
VKFLVPGTPKVMEASISRVVENDKFFLETNFRINYAL